VSVAVEVVEPGLRTRVERALAGRTARRDPAAGAVARPVRAVVIDEAALARGATGCWTPGGRAASGREVVLVCTPRGRRAALELLAARRVRHLLPADDALEARLLGAVERMAGDCFGLARQVAGKPERRVIDSPAAKSPALDELGAAAAVALPHPMLADLLVAAVDEMLINALYRTAAAHPPVLEWAVDQRSLGVSVSDGAGALGESDVFMGLALALAHEQGGLPAGERSAALGFRVMLGGLSYLALNVRQGKTTEVIGVVDRGRSLREHRRATPGFGIFLR
jgi:hypothetical protein